jgi:glycolate oxidase
LPDRILTDPRSADERNGAVPIATATVPTPPTSSAPSAQSDLAELRALLGDAVLSEDPGVLAEHAIDRSGWPAQDGGPIAVVRARSVEDVQATMRYAHANGVPVVARGAGTGLAGGAIATAGSIVLSLAGLDRIEELRPDDALIRVEAGVITADIDAAASAHGLLYAPDPGSVAISTIGGNIATNAGGLRCAKYGVTRESVLGLDVVLADGSLVHTGRSTIKGVAGYDLTGLFVGSEGTLGVIVGATLRLRPAPRSSATLVAMFDSMADAVAASLAITAERIQPAIQEILDAAVLRAIDAAEGTEFAAQGNALLLVQTDGAAALEEARIAMHAIAPLADSVSVSDDPAEAARLISARRLALPSLERLGRVLIEDIAVPRSRLPEAAVRIAEIGDRHGVLIAVMAHAGDGNLHPIVVLPDTGPAAPIPQDAQLAANEIFALALELGGTITGEHGIGLLKRAWIDAELGEPNAALQRQVRLLFDPRGILNPGKAI